MGLGPLRLFFAGQLEPGVCHYEPRRNIIQGNNMPRECPKCDRALTRTRRQPWMHRIPGSKYYVCRECSFAYLLSFDRWLFKWKRYLERISRSKGS